LIIEVRVEFFKSETLKPRSIFVCVADWQQLKSFVSFVVIKTLIFRQTSVLTAGMKSSSSSSTRHKMLPRVEQSVSPGRMGREPGVGTKARGAILFPSTGVIRTGFAEEAVPRARPRRLFENDGGGPGGGGIRTDSEQGEKN
jgi:hypothetical protein